MEGQISLKALHPIISVIKLFWHCVDQLKALNTKVAVLTYP